MEYFSLTNWSYPILFILFSCFLPEEWKSRLATLKWVQPFSFLIPYQKSIVRTVQALFMAMTVIFSFIHGVFEPIEQWGIQSSLQLHQTMASQKQAFSIVNNELDPDRILLYMAIPKQPQPTLFEKNSPGPPRILSWSQVLGYAYTNFEKQDFFLPVSQVPFENMVPFHSANSGGGAQAQVRRLTQGVIVSFILAGSLLSVWVPVWFGRRGAVWVVGVLGLSYLVAVYVWLMHTHVWVDLVPFPLAVTLGCGVGAIQCEGRHPLRSFPSPVRKTLFSCSRQRRMVTVLFADIRGFSRIAETLSLDEVCTFLEQYQSAMTEAIVGHGGAIDKYMGDGVMALFNAYHEEPDHATQAVRAALDCHKRLGRLATHFHTQYGHPVTIGIGIHTGEALVGRIGSHQRMESTAIGDAVNLAANLEALSKIYGIPIVISEATQESLSIDHHARFLDEIRVKGRERFVRLHTVVEQDERRVSRLPMRGRAMLQRVGKWSWGNIGNVSAQGLSLENLDHPLEEGCLFNLHINSSHQRAFRLMQAKVVWAQAHRAGLEFVSSMPNIQTSIGHSVEHSSLTSSPKQSVPFGSS